MCSGQQETLVIKKCLVWLGGCEEQVGVVALIQVQPLTPD